MVKKSTTGRRREGREADAHAAHLGELVRRLRLERGLSQNDLVAMSGVPQQTLSSIETGDNKRAGLETIRRLARALQVTLADIDKSLPEPAGVDLAARARPHGRPPG